MESSVLATPRTLRAALRWGGPLAWAIGLVVYSDARGLPVARDRLFIWIFLGLVAFTLTDLRKLGRGLLVDWLPFAGILFLYDFVRGFADGLVFPVRWTPQIRADQVLFGHVVPTVWLQRHLWHGQHHIHWYDYLAWATYVSHFFGTLVVAAALWIVAHARFRRYAVNVCVLAVVGFATYVLFPAAPPWLASRDGYISPAPRLTSIIWGHVPGAPFRPLFESGKHYANNVAAVPSLHAAYALLIALFLWRSARWRWRIPLGLYPFAMGFSLVYLSEHYVVDIILGWIYALVVFFAIERIVEARSRRRLTLATAGAEP